METATFMPFDDDEALWQELHPPIENASKHATRNRDFTPRR